MKKITKIKKPHIAKLDEVTITRDGDTAIIEYKDPGISTVHIKIGNKIENMRDEDILNCHNQCLDAQLESALNYKYIATEIPSGKPQVEYFEPGAHWTPRADVLRCEISWDSKNGTAILIDDQEYSLKEFGEMLSTREGWGMRIIFVPDDEIYKSPPIEIKDPNENKTPSVMLSEDPTEIVEH